MKKINWAIIGLGKQAEKIAAAINATDNKLTAVLTNNTDRGKLFAKKFGAKEIHNSLASFLKSRIFDAVFIASPNFLHAEQSLAVIKAKKHVLCEKPMAIYLKDGLKIKKLAEKNQILFGVGFHLRFHPVFKKAKKIISQKRLGDIRFIEAHWSTGNFGKNDFPLLPFYRRWREKWSQAGGGALTARGVHLFDLINFLTSEKIQELTAFFNDKNLRQTEKTTTGIIRTNRFLISLTSSRNLPLAENRLVIYGSNACLKIDNPFRPDGRGTLKVTNSHGSKQYKFNRPTDLYQKEIDSFSKAVLKIKKWQGATLEDGLKTVALSESWITSAKTGRAIRIKNLIIKRP